MKKILTKIFVMLLLAGALVGQQAVINCHTPKTPCLRAIPECTQGDGGDKVTLTWTQEKQSEVSWFELEKFTRGSWSVLAVISKNDNSYVDHDVEEGEKYYYRLRAVIKWSSRDIRPSPWSNASAEVPVCKLPPNPKDCEIDVDTVLEYFQAHVLQYIRESDGKLMYYVQFEIEVNGGSRDGYWELLRSDYKVKELEDWENYNKPFKKRPGAIFRGGQSDYYFEDYAVSRHKEFHYILRWNCGPCRDWVYFGSKVVRIPKK